MIVRLTIFAILLCIPVTVNALDTDNVASAPTEICPILIGSELPTITLQDLSGKSFDLNKAVATKPTVLIYFRGGW